jgi:hypothetical protein
MKHSHRRCRRVSGTLLVLAVLAWAISASVLSGCGGNSGPERVVVTGTVTYNGKPIPDGAILFAPTTSLPTTAAIVLDGRYKADGLGGVPVGTHKVQFEAFRTDPLPGRSPARLRFGDTVRTQYLPNKFNVDSQLQITIPPGSRQITKNFDLTD